MNPGSKEAVEAGCTCPIFDNGQGEGLPWGGERVFWIAEDCKLHCKQLDNGNCQQIADA